MKRDIADKLYAEAIRRYKREKADFKFSPQFAERIWYIIYGKLQHEGEEAARIYVRTAPLLETEV